MRIYDRVLDVDDQIQDYFDDVVHSFMRTTGTRKRTLRRNAWGLGLLTSVCANIFTANWLMVALIFLVGSWQVYRDDRHDAEVEHSLHASKADSNAAILKIIAVLSFITTIFTAVFGHKLFIYTALWYVNDSVLLFLGYLCGTSKEPPAADPKTELNPANA